MASNKCPTNWSFVVNLANSIIGVAVLAFPLCFKQCGVILGTILVLVCGYLAHISCYLLAKSASVTKKRSYEYLAFHIFGHGGKLAVEMCSVGLLLGTLIAFFVIIGDICPEIFSEFTRTQNSTQLRTTVLLTLGLLVVLPLCLKSNLESISNLSTMSLLFYCIFAIKVVWSSVPHLITWEFLFGVTHWDTDGIFKSLPIFALSYACQIPLFLVYHSMPDISIKQINSHVSKAIGLTSVIYFLVGYFGYIAFYDKEISGDFLVNYDNSFMTGLIKLGFACSTILSFPLLVFPCRCSLYTLLLSKNFHDNIGGTVHIPTLHFKYTTCAIVIFTLAVGILVPKVEFVLGLTGSTLGSMICYILPAIMFIKAVTKDTTFHHIIAKAVLVIGIIIFIVSTWTTMYNVDMDDNLPDLTFEQKLVKPAAINFPKADFSPVIITAPPHIQLPVDPDPQPPKPFLQDEKLALPKVSSNNLSYSLKNLDDADPQQGKIVRSNLAIDIFDKFEEKNSKLKEDSIKKEKNDKLAPDGLKVEDSANRNAQLPVDPVGRKLNIMNQDNVEEGDVEIKVDDDHIKKREVDNIKKEESEDGLKKINNKKESIVDKKEKQVLTDIPPNKEIESKNIFSKHSSATKLLHILKTSAVNKITSKLLTSTPKPFEETTSKKLIQKDVTNIVEKQKLLVLEEKDNKGLK